MEPVLLNDRLAFTPKFKAYSRAPPTDARSQELSRAIEAAATEEERRRLEAEYIRTGGWNLDLKAKNTITTIGYNSIGNRLTNQGTYSSAYFPYFAWSNGTSAPSISDTATTFYADGSAWGTKAVTTIDAFDVLNLKQTWECFLSSTDNGVPSITKFALMNATPGTVMFNSVIFPALSKTTTIQRWLVYSLGMSQA